jgi:starvation-inducible DNA-binding protein
VTSRASIIADNDAVYVETDDMLAELLDDKQRFATSMREAHDVCNEHRDVATMSPLENYIDEAEKCVWLLTETSRQGEPSRH